MSTRTPYATVPDPQRTPPRFTVGETAQNVREALIEARAALKSLDNDAMRAAALRCMSARASCNQTDAAGTADLRRHLEKLERRLRSIATRGYECPGCDVSWTELWWLTSRVTVPTVAEALACWLDTKGGER